MRNILVVLIMFGFIHSSAFADKSEKSQKSSKGGLPQLTAIVDGLVVSIGEIVDFLDALEIDVPVTQLSVDCDAGGSLSAALAEIDDGGTISVSGICNEKVIISSRNSILIKGVPSATIDGTDLSQNPLAGTFDGMISLISSRDITLDNLTIANGPDGGVYLRNDSELNLVNSNVDSNAFDGMDVFGDSFVNVVNSTFNWNGRTGILGGSSTIYFSGANSANNNKTGLSLISNDVMLFAGSLDLSYNSSIGLVANDGSVFQVEGSGMLSTNDNGFWGSLLLNGSALEARGDIFAANNDQGIAMRASTMNSASPGSSITLTDNNIGLFMEASSYFNDETSEFTSTGNNVGIMARHGSTVVFDSLSFGNPNSPVVIENNLNWGIIANEGSEISIGRTMSITSNYDGIRVDDSALQLRGGASITGNTNNDVYAAFGSRLTLDAGSTITSLGCEATVLARGVSC